ncbi:hypothetical protein, partial [Roseisolibacter sp. H3M3-2]|uniref:hypothetical protein n=1 Tax=Roseisolibacter sp. H3M3-2 TaxID=3031323 RepID=UPI0023DC3485
MTRSLAAALALAAAAAPLGAQTARDDSAAVVAVVQRFLDGLSRRDTAVVRATVIAGTPFVSLPSRGDIPPGVEPLDSAIAFLATTKERLLERMWSPTVRVDGRIATVWTPYDFHVDGAFSHCGIDTFTLVQAGAAWRIASVVYTTQRTGCAPSPLGPPPPRPRAPSPRPRCSRRP